MDKNAYKKYINIYIKKHILKQFINKDYWLKMILQTTQ